MEKHIYSKVYLLRILLQIAILFFYFYTKEKIVIEYKSLIVNTTLWLLSTTIEKEWKIYTVE